MLEMELKVRLTLLGPVLTHSTAIGAIGVDSCMARRPEDGRFYLPFSLVRGRLRQSWEEMDGVDGHSLPVRIDDLLGGHTGDEFNVEQSPEPQRGRLRFSDFLCEKDMPAQPPVRSRIKIDPARGSVARGALQVLETPFASGEKATFTGTISYIAANAAEANAIKSQVVKGLRWITSLGAERTSGFGRLIDVQVELEERGLVGGHDVATVLSPSEVIGLVIRPLSPFCIARRRTVQNLFESDEVLSGAIIRGALATTLKAILNHPSDISDSIPEPWKELGRYFNSIRFTFAFPAASTPTSRAYKRPVSPPLSLVKDADEACFLDVALRDGPGLIGQLPMAPKFRVDWKHSDDVRGYFGWSTPKRELRVRTAIDRGKRRAAEGQLFAYEMVVPYGHEWLGHADLGRVPEDERGKVEGQLRAILESGLRSIGKTKAKAGIQLSHDVGPLFPSDSTPVERDRWVITLQAPAILCDPTDLHENSGASELEAAYRKVWRELSQGKLELVRYFACQSLAGGWYLIRRFQPGKPYNPFLLTDSGSVFVVRATADIADARNVIEAWMRGGLPLPSWAVKRYGDSWRSCPFLPVDGFGEIAVNLPCHKEKYPSEEMWHVIQ